MRFKWLINLFTNDIAIRLINRVILHPLLAQRADGIMNGEVMSPSEEDIGFSARQDVIADSEGAISDVKIVGNGLQPKIRRAVDRLLELENCCFQDDEPDRFNDLLQVAVVALRDISASTYNDLNDSDF